MTLGPASADLVQYVDISVPTPMRHGMTHRLVLVGPQPAMQEKDFRAKGTQFQ